jgi:hypothetical protein
MLDLTKSEDISLYCRRLRDAIRSNRNVIAFGGDAVCAEIQEVASWWVKGDPTRPPADVQNMRDPARLIALLKFRDPSHHSFGYLLPIIAAWSYFMAVGELDLSKPPANGVFGWAIGWWPGLAAALNFPPFPGFVLASLALGLLVQYRINRGISENHKSRVDDIVAGILGLSRAINAHICEIEKSHESISYASRLDSVVESLQKVITHLETDSTKKLIEAQSALSKLGGTIRDAADTMSAGAVQMRETASNLGDTIASLNESGAAWTRAATGSGEILTKVSDVLDRLENELSGMPATEHLSAILSSLKTLAEQAQHDADDRQKMLDLLRQAMTTLSDSASGLTKQTSEFTKQTAEYLIPALAAYDESLNLPPEQ